MFPRRKSTPNIGGQRWTVEHEWTTEELVLVVYLASRGMGHKIITEIVEHKTGGKLSISLHNLGEKMQQLRERNTMAGCGDLCDNFLHGWNL